MSRKEKIPPCPHCGTIAVHGDIRECVPILKAQRDKLRDLLADVERSAQAALVAWGSPTIARGYVADIEDRTREATLQSSEEPR